MKLGAFLLLLPASLFAQTAPLSQAMPTQQAPSQAQTPHVNQASPSSLSMHFKEVGTKAKTTSHWEDWDGSFNRDTTRQKNIAVEVMNLDKQPAPDVSVTVWWVAQSRSNGNWFIYSSETKPVTIQAGRTETVNFLSTALKENNIYDAYYGYTSTSGSRAKGFIVTVEYEGKNVSTRASSGLSQFDSERGAAALIGKIKGVNGVTR